MIGREEATCQQVSLGGPTRIIAPIMGATLAEVRTELDNLQSKAVDLVEWRVDPLLAANSPMDRGAQVTQMWEQVLSGSPLPVLASIRTSIEGGAVSLDESEYAALVSHLASKADAVDVEINRTSARELIGTIHSRGARVVASHHDFEGTRSRKELEDILLRMDEAGADILKVACMARVAEDAIRLLDVQLWARQRFSRPLIVIGMGPCGMLTRIAGSFFASSATFASSGKDSAPGQLSVEDTRRFLDILERA